MKLFVEVLTEPTVADDGLPAYREHGNGPLLGINISLPEKESHSSFDVAQIRLQGAIRSQIGDRTSVKKVLNVIEYCSWEDFAPVYSSSVTSSAYAAKVGFDFSGKAGARNVLLPSTTLSGSTYVTQHTALNDRRLVQGSCDTHCWVNVDLFKDGKSIKQYQQSVRLDCAPARLTLSPAKHEDSMSTICRPAGSVLSVLSTNKPASVEVSVAHLEQPLVSNTLSSGERMSTVDLPVEAFFHQLPQSAVDAMNVTGGITCEVEAKWYTKRTFSASSSASDEVQVAAQLVSTQSSEVHFPPTLSPLPDSHKGNAASAVGMLQLVLPISASMPSIGTDLLDISYQVELKYAFRLGTKKQPLALKGKTKVDCCLTS